MSLSQNNAAAGIGGSGANAGRMNSITKRLRGAYIRRRLGGIILGSVLLFIVASAGYLVFSEHAALGYFSVHTKRDFTVEKTIGGKVSEIVYRVSPADGRDMPGGSNSGQHEEPSEAIGAKIPVLKPLRIISFASSGLCVLRLFLLFFVTSPAYGRKIKDLMSPLNELALKADELSKIEFGEDKYRVIEDAISHLEADSSKLSLGDSDLSGIEAAINNLLVRVRESNLQQARFVNDASHELRTPIAVIGGYADMLARWGKDDEKVLDESIAAIQKESTRMKHLVEQLLFLARGDSGRTALSMEDVDLCALMQEAYEESVMIDENHVYRLVLPEQTVISSADAGLLKQAVRILIDNAAKYTKEHDEIILSVGAAQTGAYANAEQRLGTARDTSALDNLKNTQSRPYLQVQDCGIGMAEADVQHMFERFYRADEARSFEGTGLGLSIAKWIVDKHGGHFEILSREDIGTRIRIVL